MPTETEEATKADSGLATVPRWAAIPMVLAGGIVALPTGHFFGIAAAEGMALTIVMALFTAMLWWPLRRYPTSWLVVAAVIVLHLLLVFAMPWPVLHRASKGILLIFLIDVFAVIIISDRVARKLSGSLSDCRENGS